MNQRSTAQRTAILAGIAVSTLLISGCASTAPEQSNDGESNSLVIATWGGAFTEATQDNLVAAFTEETGIDVQIVDAPGTQAAQMQQMVDAGDVQWDVLDSLSAADAYFMADAGLLEPLPEDLSTRIVAEVEPERVTDFGFTFANLGYVIACNMETVDACPETVADFFDAEAYPGKRMYPGESYGPSSAVLLEATGDAPADADIARIADPLAAIKDDVTVWWTSGDQQDQAFRQGEADIAIARSGRVYTLIDEGMNMQVNWAGVYDPGFTSIAVDAPNRANAERYLEWLAANTEAQAGFAEQLQYSVPNPGAIDLLDETVASRLADYPENFEQLGTQDFEWYLEHKSEVDAAIRSVVQG